jgi:membrane protein required for colicin V production
LSPLDVIIILAAVTGFILGFKDGFIRKLVGIIGFVVAVILVALFSDDLGRAVENIFGMEFYLAEMTAGAAIFLGVILLFTLLKRVIHPFDKVNNLVNQIVGGFIGLTQIMFFVSAVFLIMNVFSIPSKETQQSSKLYKETSQLIPVTIDLLGKYTPDTKKIIKNYINEKDTLK